MIMRLGVAAQEGRSVRRPPEEIIRLEP
jgi:hypothetical protein